MFKQKPYSVDFSSVKTESSSDWSLRRSHGRMEEESAISWTGAMLGRRPPAPFTEGGTSLPPSGGLVLWRSMATVPVNYILSSFISHTRNYSSLSAWRDTAELTVPGDTKAHKELTDTEWYKDAQNDHKETQNDPKMTWNNHKKIEIAANSLQKYPPTHILRHTMTLKTHKTIAKRPQTITKWHSSTIRIYKTNTETIFLTKIQQDIQYSNFKET